MRVIITGSTSAIGRILTQRLQESGFTPIALGGSDSKIWKLGQSIPSSLEAEFLVHLAHDRTSNFEANSQSINLIVKSFTGHKVLLSSLSSHNKSRSKYGRSKFYAEKCFIGSGGSAIRAGVVFGPNSGGIYKTLESVCQTFSIVPLPYSGKSRLFFSHVDDLCAEIISLLESRQSGLFFGANGFPLSLRELLINIAKSNNKKILFVPINSRLTRLVISAIGFIGLNFSLIDSLKSLEDEISDEELFELIPSSNSFRTFQY